MDEVRLIDANALHKRIEMNLRASNPFTISLPSARQCGMCWNTCTTKRPARDR